MVMRKMWWKFLVVLVGVDIIIRCVENGGLPVGEAGGAHCAQTKEVSGMVAVTERAERFLFAPNLCIRCDEHKRLR